MRKIIFYLILVFLFQCKDAANKKIAPVAVKGVLDLRGSTSLTNHSSTEFMSSGVEAITNQTKAWNFEKDGTIELVGDWEFYWNELIEDPKEQKEFFKNYDPKKIDYISVPSLWGEHEINGKKLPANGFAMYRLRVLLPINNIPLLYYMTDVCSAYSIFINGKLELSRGKIGKSIAESMPDLRYGTFEIKENRNEVEIIVMVSNFYHGKGGFWNKLSIGDPEKFGYLLEGKKAFKHITIGSLIIMGLYHLVLYLQRRKDKSPFYFGMFCLFLMMRMVSLEERWIMDFIPSLSFDIAHKLEYISINLTLATFLFFLHDLFSEDCSRYFLNFMISIIIPATLVVVFSSPKLYTTWLLLTMQILILISVLYTLSILLLATVRKRSGSLSFLLGTIVFASAVVNDILYGMNLIHTTHISGYGFLFFIFSQSVILSIRFSNAFTLSENQAVELKDKTDSLLTSNLALTELKEGLEIKVEERTKKLEEVFQRNLREEQKVAKLKAEIFTIQERENLFFDIHDHIKGDVSELGLLIEKIKNFQVPTDISNQASLLLKRVATSVKNRMLMLEDKQLLEEDFRNGLQMSLLRRYTALNRRFIFELDELTENKLSQTSAEFKNTFYSIATEISTNDLKYGFGNSFWKIEILNSNLLKLEMKSNSNYTMSLDTGKGYMGISRKLEQLQGRLEEENLNGLYKITIWIPV